MRIRDLLKKKDVNDVNLLEVIVKGRGLNDFNPSRPGTSTESCGLNACEVCGTSTRSEEIKATHLNNYAAWQKSPNFTPL